MNVDLIKKEIKDVDKNNLIITIGTTSRISNDFSILPRRTLLSYEVINILVSSSETARKCLTYIDGKASKILVDVEKKQIDHLWEIALNTIKITPIYQYKPNDITVEAADLQINSILGKDIAANKIILYGNGNIAGKLALRLAERGVKVYLYGRNLEKNKLLVAALNSILPRHASEDLIIAIENISDLKTGSIDGLVSFVSSEQVIGEEWLKPLKFRGFVIDGGINNFSHSFYLVSREWELLCLRLDVRIAFPYAGLCLQKEVLDFFDLIQGSKRIEGVNIVAGGVIGEKGDVIVDRLDFPTQLIGIANGIGGVKSGNEETTADRERIDFIKKHILQSNKKNF
ncbi:hypothetical protein [Bacillus sp. FJAT-44742]|uniref:hypothetical protein n=1 Tax=Bacillus sp. FJAT-44742 TaxID=2014005 RepID=UPI000C23C397|nr:hypothetical protein [Bacillus sp. FJAT-44742]